MVASKVCRCVSRGCGSKLHVNDLGLPCPGVLVTLKEYSTHSKEDKAFQRHDFLASQRNELDLRPAADDRNTLQAPVQNSSLQPTLSFGTRSPVAASSSAASPSAASPSAASPSAASPDRHTFDTFEYLSDISKELKERRLAFPGLHSVKLVFVNTSDDIAHMEKTSAKNCQSRSPNSGPFSLRYAAVENAPFLLYEAWIADHVREVYDIATKGSSELGLIKNDLLFDLVGEWDRLDRLKQENYTTREDLSCSGRIVVSTRQYSDLSICSRSNVLAICYIIVAVLHLFCLVSQDRCDFVATALQLLLRITGSDVHKSMPKDTRTILNALQLSPVTRAYVSCPRCCKLYPVPENTLDDEVPEKCIAETSRGGPLCGRSLRRIRVVNGVANLLYSRLFLYQVFKHWFARFICRPGIEELLDRDVFAQGSLENQQDIWDGSVLRNFKGADGLPFVRRDGGGRYVFMFSWDGLNPLGSREGGKKISVGAIYMTCLNLPASLRYERENIYLVGIIPGPNEPSREQINHFVAPLVDDFMEFWSPGYYLESTPRHPNGRTVEGAIVPVLSDLLALKQVVGLSSHSSNNFCSFCWLQLENIDDICLERWIVRDPQEHRRLAKQWLDAESEEDRSLLFDSHGVRHSEFLRLPYWDPVEFLSIDSMHAFLLGNLKRHCRNVWGFDISYTDDDGSTRGVPDHSTGGKA